ncbi:MAG: hypothetical protein HY562_13010 [Ignavibacteriales bacterium]|nr:hypothetical protein [Ignavibacteriales bacterium]
MKHAVRVYLLFFVSIFVFGIAASQDKKGTDVTLKGELIDIKCYSSGMGGGRGEEHQDCAIQCMKGGLPVGLLDDKGTLYMLVPKKGMKGGNEALAEHAAHTLTVKGTLQDKGGMKVLHYTSFEMAK